MVKAAFWKKCKPTVSRHWLLLTAGLFWSAVGIFLCIMACYWLAHLEWPLNGIGVLLGFGGGIAVYRFGFSRIAKKNIARILKKSENVCFFAFQAWKSYLLVIVMMSFGYTLRHLHTPRIFLAVIYAAVGTGLALSSSLYYK